nr:MAG TPA: hypothetical protein [Crassvirales sp.]
MKVATRVELDTSSTLLIYGSSVRSTRITH